MMDDQTLEVFTKRGIDPAIAEARPHVPYAQGDTAAILAADPKWGGSKGLKIHLGSVVNQSSGIAMRRHPALLPETSEGDRSFWAAYEREMGAGPILAELRPDEAVLIRERHPHKHAAEPEVATHEWEVEHLRRFDVDPSRRVRKPKEYAQYREAHENPTEYHGHAHEAKYVFPSGSKNAKRLDMHPGARPLLEQAKKDGGVVFYALEGCLKADSLLTKGQPVISVPSVSLWHPTELATFAERHLLGGVTVVVLTDSDWRTNPNVMGYGMLATSYLTDLGVRAVFGAPAPIDDDPKTGIDDMLARKLDALDVKLVEHDVPDMDLLRRMVGEALPTKAGVSRDVAARVFLWHLLHATTAGHVKGGGKRCAGWLYPDRVPNTQPFDAAVRQVKRARAALRDAGLVHQVEPIRHVRKWDSDEWMILPPTDLILPRHRVIRARSDRTLREYLDS